MRSCSESAGAGTADSRSCQAASQSERRPHENNREIIALFGGIDGLHVSITNEPYMRLVIEHIGDGPHGLPAISVAHYYELNGDLCQDPEMCFEVDSTPAGLVMNPYMFQMANPPVYQEVSDDARGVALAGELREFAAMWDKNLSDQGFLEAATRLRPSAAVQSGGNHDQSR